MAAPRIIVHHVPFTRSQRVVWALEELGLKYEVKVHHFARGGMPPSIYALNPVGKAPVVEIDGKVMVESGAIVHYLLQNYGQRNPALESTPSQDSYFWAMFSEGTLMFQVQPGRFVGFTAAALLKSGGLNDDEKRGVQTLNAAWQGSVTKTVSAALGVVEAALAKFEGTGGFFSGSDRLGEGDFMMTYVLGQLSAKGSAYEIGPATRAYLARVGARPAFQAATKRLKEEEKAQPRPGKEAKL
ncbi:hypothetical protein Q8F55_005753 [Vanrija albida]|uniref:GST N-terminal domain-containing protein n=1 Tax=Vanrija albida TaxID=181172 RepID=A0ABR3Q2G7_9TREE